MGYLICEKCGGYYKLQPGEYLEDFDRCYCGGRLKYEEYLHYNPTNPQNMSFLSNFHIFPSLLWPLALFLIIFLITNYTISSQNRFIIFPILLLIMVIYFIFTKNNRNRRHRTDNSGGSTDYGDPWGSGDPNDSGNSGGSWDPGDFGDFGDFGD